MLPGSTEALSNINKKGELPSYIAMKNRFDDIASLMYVNAFNFCSFYHLLE